MIKNFIFSADEKLIADATAYAQAHGKTLEDFILDYLNSLTKQRDPKRVAEEFAKLTTEEAGHSEPGWKFRREEIYHRGN